jgi:hypothetical protein
MTTTIKLSESDLRQFAGGTDSYYRHAINRHVLFTDGAKYVADEGGAYWLLDEIAIVQGHLRELQGQPFQVWKLEVRPDRSATLRVEDGNYNLLLVKDIEYTDFPVAEITLWFSNNVIYLPCEH